MRNLDSGHKVVTSTYQKIAIDIAKGIINGKYSLGEKLSGRSTLAGYYGVSPETIRRAVYNLKDVGIVDINKGSGIEILSIKNAAKFAQRFEESESIAKLSEDINNKMKQQKNLQDELFKNLLKLIEITEKRKELNPFTPFIIHIKKGMNNIGKTSSEVNFWHNTGATIIAIKRGKRLILSPGPYAIFKENDVLYYIGDDSCHKRVEDLFKN